MSKIYVLTRRDIEFIFDGAASIYDCMGPAIFDGFAEQLVRDMPIRHGMKALDVARFKDEYLAKLSSARHEDGYHMATAVIYATATRN